MRSNFVLGLALTCLASCKGDDKTNRLGNTASAKLEASEILPPSDLPLLTADQAKATLNASTYIENDRGSNKTSLLETPVANDGETTEVDLAELCLDQMINEIVIHASQDTLVVDQTFDFRSCLIEKAASKGNITVDITEASASYYILSSCEGADFSSFNGKKLSEAGEIPETCAGKISYQLTSRSRSQVTVTTDGTPHVYNTETVDSQSLADGSPCEASLTNGLRVENQCISIMKHIDYGTPANTRYTKFESKDLAWADAETGSYYNSGTLSLIVNDWSGTLTYAGRQTLPTFVMTRGEETVNGSIAGEVLNLKDKIHIELSKKLKLIQKPKF